MKTDVVCLLYKAENYIDGLLQRIKAQKGVQLGCVVFAITRRQTDSQVDDEVMQKIAAAGYTYFLVEKEEFSHSLTREKAIFDYCTSERVVMLSQDVVFLSDDCLFQLCSAVNDEVVYAYGRQVCLKKTIEHYVREKNYPQNSQTVGKADVEKLQLGAFFSSDAFSVYHRPTFIQLGGYDHVPMMMSEDMYYSKKAIDNGYKKGYVANAVVEHSHKMTLKQLYQRYYDTGIWFGEHKEFDAYKTTDSGFKLALYVFKKALKDCNVPVLLRFIPDMSARYLGMQKGKRAKGRKKNDA